MGVSISFLGIYLFILVILEVVLPLMGFLKYYFEMTSPPNNHHYLF